MRLPNLTGEFRVASDPELRFTPAGKAVTNLAVIASESKKNEQTGEWEDGDKTPYLNLSIWGQAAEEVAEHVTKGERVLVSGALYVREYDKSDGSKGQSMELKFATIGQIPGGKAKGARNPNNQVQRSSAPAQSDPWATPAATTADPWATPPANQEPPF